MQSVRQTSDSLSEVAASHDGKLDFDADRLWQSMAKRHLST